MPDIVVNPDKVQRVIMAGATAGKVIHRLRTVVAGHPVLLDIDESCATGCCPNCNRIEQQMSDLRGDLAKAEARIAELLPSLVDKGVRR